MSCSWVVAQLFKARALLDSCDKQLTFHSGTQQAVANIGPAQIHPHNSKDHNKESTRSRAQNESNGLGFGPNRPKPRNGKAHEQREAGPCDEEPRAELYSVASGPREGEGVGQGLVLVNGLLVQGHGAARFWRGIADERGILGKVDCVGVFGYGEVVVRTTYNGGIDCVWDIQVSTLESDSSNNLHRVHPSPWY
ncbi:nuclear RNA polymerase D2A [Striga asiatica]|uniref:Nuclear RNA polymerase D2A n=1 Tax=Striga asiatica TaxID=4170 RepID=A0A5A7PIR0_STRAF|nr:nuclear RNA polymerase D2A [Striga asiatica]